MSWRQSESRMVRQPSISEICGKRLAWAWILTLLAHLDIEVGQDLDQGRLEARDLHAILDALDQSDRINLRANIFKQSSDECYVARF